MKSHVTGTVLIVDDVKVNLKILERMILASGCSCVLADSGMGALEILSKKKIDLILLDVVMPDMNGFEVCEKIKGNMDTKDIPVIFITVEASSDDIVKGFEVGGADYVSKPFHEIELIARMKTHMELKQSRDEIRTFNEELLKANDRLFELNQSMIPNHEPIAPNDLKGPK